MAKDWYVDSGLKVLNEQLKVKYPGIVIGTIGDRKHQEEHSDHNPDPDGSVDASDLMIGPHFTRDDCAEVMESLRKSQDERIGYLIWDHHICSSTHDKWIWVPYHGADPHTGHGHVSVNDLHHGNLNPWKIDGSAPMPRKLTYVSATVFMPVLREGDKDTDFDGFDMIRRMQREVFDDPKMWDGIWGKKTTEALGMHEITLEKYRNLYGLALS